MHSCCIQYLGKKQFGCLLLIILSSVLLLSVHNHAIQESGDYHSDCPLCYFSSISLDTPIPAPTLIFLIFWSSLSPILLYITPRISLSELDTRAPPFSYPLN